MFDIVVVTEVWSQLLSWMLGINKLPPSLSHPLGRRASSTVTAELSAAPGSIPEGSQLEPPPCQATHFPPGQYLVPRPPH